MSKWKLYPVIAILSMLTLVAGACVQPSPTQTPTHVATGTLEVYVTDAPPDDEVTSIMVTVSEVQVHKAVAEQEQQQEQEQEQQQEQEQEQEQGEWISIDISNDAKTFDLLDIAGIEQYLGTSEIEATKYTQVRLVVETVQVEFNDSGELKDASVPSKELKIVHPFQITGGDTTTLVIDFDADKMVTVTGSGDIIVKPVVKLTVKQEMPSEEVTLEGTTWILQSYGESDNLKTVLADTEITATFNSDDGMVEGSAGCNNYSGSYEVEDNQLSISEPIIATEILCTEPEGIIEQEQEYLAALQLAGSFEIGDNELRINCGSQSLIFQRE